MSLYLKISANFRLGKTLPTIDDQYRDLWKLASFLETMGLPIWQWRPPADTPENVRLNSAFSASGPTAAALAIAKANKDNLASDLRMLGVWNGEEDSGGMTYTTTYMSNHIPSNLRLAEDSVPAFQDYQNIVKLIRAILEIWQPMVVKVTPSGYDEQKIFPDRPPVGWMIYLPFEVSAKQIPEAAQTIPIFGHGKEVRGTIIVSTTEVFDVKNSEHIKTANAIETRLVDQDLLPTIRDLVTNF